MNAIKACAALSVLDEDEVELPDEAEEDDWEEELPPTPIWDNAWAMALMKPPPGGGPENWPIPTPWLALGPLNEPPTLLSWPSWLIWDNQLFDEEILSIDMIRLTLEVDEDLL